MTDCPRFCAICPMVQKGVTAALTGAEVVTRGELNRFRFARDAPEVAQQFTGQTRIYAKVIASDVPHVEVDDTATMLVRAEGLGYTDLKALVQNCSGPKFTWWQKIFDLKGRCGAIDNRR